MPSNTFPSYRGKLEYHCLKCQAKHPAEALLYTCPECGGVLLLENSAKDKLKHTSGLAWRKIFEERSATTKPALKGIFRYYELLAPVLEEEDIIFLGEGHTSIVAASANLQKIIGSPFAFKNEGQNPSASFKDRGMACAFSALKWLCRKNNFKEVLALCASTGDTSASAALYAAWVGDPIKCAVLLPQGKITPQQLAQPLGSGAKVLEIPGVFDDCMKVVEILAENYNIALLNSKNSWRILGQQSYAYEIAQNYDWNVADLAIFVPVGNAGNITAIMSGFLEMLDLGIISALPRIFGVQSEHANPLCLYYHAPANQREWQPVKVKPSVAQAAMIGNPVSFPRVRYLAEKYLALGSDQAFQMVQVSEQQIMDSMLLANANGHIACTQGGECLAGLRKALETKILPKNSYPVLDATAHALKFANFQTDCFNNSLDPAYKIKPNPELCNAPVILNENAQATDNQDHHALAQLLADTLKLEKK